MHSYSKLETLLNMSDGSLFKPVSVRASHTQNNYKVSPNN